MEFKVRIVVIFKECMIKGKNYQRLYIHKLYFNALKMVSELGKVAKCTLFLQCFPSSGDTFYYTFSS